MQFHAQTSGGHTRVVTVTRIVGDMVTVDGNHPLAGENLNFDVEVTEVREASAEELEHGHVHGPGGHHHHGHDHSHD
jgi:FKBP-type peptidyl-prolyl cis-trans isomerase SlyD